MNILHAVSPLAAAGYVGIGVVIGGAMALFVVSWLVAASRADEASDEASTEAATDDAIDAAFEQGVTLGAAGLASLRRERRSGPAVWN